ncbi:MAG: sulfite exporter TauE/SafE family protein [Vicinamibacterales bacterium]|nr:sulfite exporter TauE/SafE family protein [Vicinamibacterales bacterium]
MDAKTILLAALVALTLSYLIGWFTMARRRRAEGGHGADEPVMPRPIHLAIGAVTNFFDTLGIGSFATTTASYKFWKLVPDEQIPGTLNVGHTINAVVQALVFISVVQVEFRTLFLMIAAACAGAWLGAGVVSGMSRRTVQLGMGSALLGASVIVIAQILDLAPGGNALALDGTRLAIGVAGNFMLGALMTLGVGLYAPCMVLVSVLGMDPTAAFPIMMGSCAFLMPVASLQFARRNAYNLRAALGLALGGPLAVLLAIWLVISLPTLLLRVLVLTVILYTAITMLRSAAVEKRKGVA